MNAYRALMRKKILEDIYDKLSDEDKRLFVQMTFQDKNSREIKNALAGISKQVEDSKHSFATDLLANVSGNAIWDSIVYFANRLIKKL